MEGLKNPNFAKWNPDAQMFISRVQTDLENNIILQDLLSQIEQLLDEYDFNSGKELFAMFDSLRKEKAEAAILKEKQEITLGEFIKEVIEELRHPVKRKPSSNFQPYTTLLHKLEREGTIIKTTISKVNRHSFVQFSEWILRQKGLKGSGN
ncbi:MAG: hypothetical protein K2O38_06965 [Muribaculaceae bacterium]|nr:hypothetical protein [Muribaculaceae bacterium]